MRRLVGPELVNVIGSEELLPIDTFPKDSAAGLGVSDSLVTPTPPTPTYSVEFDALLVKERVPSAQPATVGMNVRLRLTLCPAATVKGRLKFATANSGVLELTAVIVTLLDPEFVRLTGTVSFCWSTMVPNLTFLGLQLSW